MIVVASMILRAARELELWLGGRRPITWLLFRHLVNKGNGWLWRQNKDDFLTRKTTSIVSTPKSDWRALQQPPTIFVLMLEFVWEGHWDSACSDWHPHMSEAKIEVNDMWMQCSAQVRLPTEWKRDSISLFEISPGIGWQVDCMQPLLRRS